MRLKRDVYAGNVTATLLSNSVMEWYNIWIDKLIAFVLILAPLIAFYSFAYQFTLNLHSLHAYHYMRSTNLHISDMQYYTQIYICLIFR